jgi:transposase
MTDKCFLGFDVARDWLDVFEHPAGTATRIDNNPAAIAAFVARFQQNPDVLAAFEPTGGYEKPLRRALLEAQVRFARVHPNEVIAFRRLRGVRAKTDRIDARLIAEFAATELSRRGLAPMIEGDERLRELVARRRQLSGSLQAERNRLALIDDSFVVKSYTAVIDVLETTLAGIEKAIADHIASKKDLTTMSANLRSVKDVGPVTVMTLLAELPELGRLTGKEIAALVGLAPINRDSGHSSRRARIGHGRPGVRAVLFNVARCAIRTNDVMKQTYDRLVTVNKRPGKVAFAAIMRKLLVTLNAIARDGQKWRHAA